MPTISSPKLILLILLIKMSYEGVCPRSNDRQIKKSEEINIETRSIQVISVPSERPLSVKIIMNELFVTLVMMAFNIDGKFAPQLLSIQKDRPKEYEFHANQLPAGNTKAYFYQFSSQQDVDSRIKLEFTVKMNDVSENILLNQVLVSGGDYLYWNSLIPINLPDKFDHLKLTSTNPMMINGINQTEHIFTGESANSSKNPLKAQFYIMRIQALDEVIDSPQTFKDKILMESIVCEIFCQTSDSTNGRDKDTPINECRCQDNYEWSTARDPPICVRVCPQDDAKYASTTPLTPFDQCECANDYIWDKKVKKCVWDCSKIINKVDRTIKTLDDQCECADDFLWNLTIKNCLYNCSTVVHKVDRTSETPLDECECTTGYGWNQTFGQCVWDCSTVIHKVDRTSNTALDQCQCAVNYIWNQTFELCVWNCSAIAYKVDRTSNTALDQCECAQNFVWDLILQKCVWNCSTVVHKFERTSETPLEECECLPEFKWILSDNLSDSFCQRDCDLSAFSELRISSTPIDACECKAGYEWNDFENSCESKCTGDFSACGLLCIKDGIKSNRQFCDTMGDTPGCINCKVTQGWFCSGNQPQTCTTVCGNGIMTPIYEQCDTRHPGCQNCKVVNGYKCEFNRCSKISFCGDRIVDQGEKCDNGNQKGCSQGCLIDKGFNCASRIGQTSICSESSSNPLPPSLPAECGNSILEEGEKCDNGGKSGCQGCIVEDGFDCFLINKQSQCFRKKPTKSSVCQNGKLEVGEECDTGIKSQTFLGGCHQNCKIREGYSCTGELGETSQCLLKSAMETCGNGIIEGEEKCDNFRAEGCRNCNLQPLWRCYLVEKTSVCIFSCGNGFIEAPIGQFCDDKNLINGDGCNNRCEIENSWNCLPQSNGTSKCMKKNKFTCGDGIVNPNYENCDDGNKKSMDGCSSACKKEVGFECSDGVPNVCERTCGNGKFDSRTEECDDSNRNSGDGCSSKCKVEGGYRCPTEGREGLVTICYETQPNGFCGNHRIDEGEDCDYGFPPQQNQFCTQNCKKKGPDILCFVRRDGTMATCMRK